MSEQEQQVETDTVKKLPLCIYIGPEEMDLMDEKTWPTVVTLSPTDDVEAKLRELLGGDDIVREELGQMDHEIGVITLATRGKLKAVVHTDPRAEPALYKWREMLKRDMETLKVILGKAERGPGDCPCGHCPPREVDPATAN